MTFHIITIFPDIFSSYFNESIIKRALEKNQIEINIVNLRDFATDKHKTVDDTPYGGGAGMVMKIEPLYRAIRSLKKQETRNNNQTISNFPAQGWSASGGQFPISKIILTSAKGKTWNQKLAAEYAELQDIIIICGRYEGVDERILNYADEEVSIGDYILTGGEIPAMAIVDSVTRLLPGVLGNPDSIKDESFSNKFDTRSAGWRTTLDTSLEYPQYTKPEVFIDDDKNEHRVPEILLSGNHGEIEKWREAMKKNK